MTKQPKTGLRRRNYNSFFILIINGLTTLKSILKAKYLPNLIFTILINPIICLSCDENRVI